MRIQVSFATPFPGARYRLIIKPGHPRFPLIQLVPLTTAALPLPALLQEDTGVWHQTRL
jgi:hypothetical protein